MEPVSEEPDGLEGDGGAQRATYRRGLSVGVINFGTLAVFGVASSIVIARLYGVALIGENALTLAPTLAMAFLSSVREQTGLVRKLAVLPPRHPHVTGLWVAVFLFSFALTVAVGALVAVVTWWGLSGPVGRPDLVAPALVQLAGYVIITNTCWNLDMVLSSFRAATSLFGSQVAQAGAYFAVAVGAALIWTPTLAWLVASTIIMWIAGLLYRIPACLRYMSFSPTRAELRRGLVELPEIIRFGLRLAPGGIVDGVNSQAGVWVLGALAPVTSVGAYDRATTLARRFLDLGNRITEMLLPTMVERHANGDAEGMTRSMVDTARYVAIAMLLVASVGSGASAGIMQVFGEGFVQGRWVLALGLVAAALGLITGILDMGILALNRPGMLSLVAIGRTAVSITLVVPLTLWLDLTGTALAAAVGQVVGLTWATAWVMRNMPVSPIAFLRVREGVAFAAASATGFASAYAVDRALQDPGLWANGLPGALIALMVGSLVYLGIFVALGGLGPRDRDRIGELRRRLADRRSPETGVSSLPDASSSGAGDDPRGTAP